MTITLDIDAANSKAAIYKGTDSAALYNPAANAADIVFHSEYEYAGISQVRTGVASFTATQFSETLFGHGLGFTPLVLGFLTYGGRNIPLIGTVVIDHGSGYHLISLGANGTNVVLNRSSLDASEALSIAYTIYVFSVGVSAGGDYVRPAVTNGIDITSGQIAMGAFKSQNYHLWQSGSGPLHIPRGRTMDFGVGWSTAPGISRLALGFRYSVSGHVAQRRTLNAGGSFGGTSTTFSANVTRADV